MRGAMIAALIAVLALGHADDAPYDLRTLGGASMQCSACSIVASKLDDAIDSKLIKGWAGWTSADRAKKLSAAFKKRACPPIESMQIAVMGQEGNQKFVDFNEAMKKGGTMSNLNMGPEQTKAVATLCNAVAKQSPPLVARIEAALKMKKKGKKRRLADLKMRDELCRRLLGACEEDDEDGDTDDDDDDDEDDDDEDDDREL